MTKCTADDCKLFESWADAYKDQDEFRSRKFPKPGFLTAAEKAELASDLIKFVFPKYCDCQAVLGETAAKTELIACDADGGCIGHRWYHLECLKESKPAGNQSWICPKCRE